MAEASILGDIYYKGLENELSAGDKYYFVGLTDSNNEILAVSELRTECENSDNAANIYNSELTSAQTAASGNKLAWFDTTEKNLHIYNIGYARTKGIKPGIAVGFGIYEVASGESVEAYDGVHFWGPAGAGEGNVIPTRIMITGSLNNETGVSIDTATNFMFNGAQITFIEESI